MRFRLPDVSGASAPLSVAAEAAPAPSACGELSCLAFFPDGGFSVDGELSNFLFSFFADLVFAGVSFFADFLADPFLVELPCNRHFFF